MPDKLSDEDLKWAFHLGSGYRNRRAIRIFGEELLRRASFDGKPDRLEAYARLAEEEEDLDRVLEYIESGRQAMEKLAWFKRG